MKVSKENKVLLGTAVVGAGILGFLYWKKKKKEAEEDLMVYTPEPVAPATPKVTIQQPTVGAVLDKNKLLFKGINFYELALFGEATFDKYLQFKYVTFRGYTHFRATTFNDGLDLEYANIEKEMNFFGITNLDSKQSEEKTSQETYRIVKYQLEKVGNIIDANKYAALELNKKRMSSCQDCHGFYSFLDCIVLSIHKLSSNFSKNWILSLFWIFVVGLIFNFCLTNEFFSMNFFKYISLLTSKEDFCSNYLLFVLNKVILGYLYYQFVTAIRKDTRK